MNQRTSQATINSSVSTGLARTIGQMTEAAALKWNGGSAKMELVKGDPEFQEMLFKLWDERSAKRAELLAFTERPAWRTVTIGTHKSKQDLQKTVENEGHRISDWAKHVIDNEKFSVETTERKLDLFTCTVAKLGFPKGGRVDAIYARLDELGFGKCPDETTLQLRREYKDQPMDEWRRVISEPLAGAFGYLNVLSVERDRDGSWVYGIDARPGSVWNGYCRLVFCRK